MNSPFTSNGTARTPVIKRTPGSRALVAAAFRCLLLITLAMHFIGTAAPASKPRVWIYSDMSDKRIPGSNAERTVNDPDDISAMAGYLLMANEFETLGIVVDQHASQPASDLA